MGNLNKILAYQKELGLKPRVNNFQDKLVIQKTTCLLKLSGIHLDYSFSLYVRGPYSPGLTKDLYANMEMVNKLQTNYTPTEHEKRLLHTISELSDNLDPALLEIMSTYEFLVKELHNDEKEAITNLKKLKSFYSEGRIAVGISRTKQLFFKPTEKEIEKMKVEFGAWEEASLTDRSRE